MPVVCEERGVGKNMKNTKAKIKRVYMIDDKGTSLYFDCDQPEELKKVFIGQGFKECSYKKFREVRGKSESSIAVDSNGIVSIEK